MQFIHRVLQLATLVALPLGSALAQDSGRPDGVRFLPDVIGQISALTERADPLGLRIGTSPNPSSCKHYQGIARVQGPDGTPFFIVSRSGNTPPVPILPDGLACDDSPGETDNGNLVVFRMGSRDKHGERLRSNRLQKGVHVDDTPPPPSDVATIFYSVKDGGLVRRNGDGPITGRYGHPGGMQVVGTTLALAVEHPYSGGVPKSLVMFFDVGNPETPVFKGQFPLVGANGEQLETAGVVAVTPMPDDHYLMAVTGGANNPVVYFYRSTGTELRGCATCWTLVDAWVADTLSNPIGAGTDFCVATGAVMGAGRACLSPDEVYLGQNWPDGSTGAFTHQTLQFLREGNINGRLFLAGIRGKFGSEDSHVDAYRVDCVTSACDRGEIRLKHLLTKAFTTRPGTGGTRLASFAAASTLYTSPSGELILYATEHDNDGPSGAVKAGEWRQRNVVRQDSPTLLPSIVLNGPYVVDEGSSVVLSAIAAPPITGPFVQLFGATDFRSFHTIVDHRDYGLDDFDNLFALEFQLLVPAPFFLADRARSLNWLAPPGCGIEVIDRDTGGNLIKLRTLAGGGVVQQVGDLRDLPPDFGSGDMDQVIDMVRFQANCGASAEALPTLSWDLDRDGIYETSGSTVTLGTTAIDGPAVVSIPVQARHPYGGAAGQQVAKVTVRNVAPRITQLRLADSAGNEVGAVVPFVLTGQPVRLSAQFADPGLLDRQTALIAWGDGSIDAQTAFVAFEDGYGDGKGSLAHVHRFVAAGNYPIGLAVTDDDGGTGTSARAVRVLSPGQAVAELIQLIDAAIASTSNTNARAALGHARRALAGSNDHSQNGALRAIAAGTGSAAHAFLRTAITWLERARADGADVAPLIALLRQVDAALA